MAEPMRPQIRADCPINPDPTKPVQTTCLSPDCPVHGVVLMAEPMTLRKMLADAYHEHHCGRPPSCEVGRRTYCEGKIDPELLGKLVKRIALRADLAQQRIEAVLADHVRDSFGYCVACNHEHPCNTRRALTGDGPDEGG